MGKSRIVLYADEFDGDAWATYCEICGESPRASSLTIYFDASEVEADYCDDDDDDE